MTEKAALTGQGILSVLGRLMERSWFATPFSVRFKWLLAPDLLDAGYAFRTTIASLVALGIALWMELGSPQWAALTVWMVAQGSRGKSIAKARWHMFGMIVGTIAAFILVSSTPQQPLLFILLLAASIGGLCFIGTFLPGPASMSNYRMHGMRASGFTLSIIAIDGISAPDHMFEIAMARATYITLGIVIETSFSSLFQFHLTQRARDRLSDNFISAMHQVSATLSKLLNNDRTALKTSPEMLVSLAALGDQVEFAEIEMGRHGHEGDHARAALASITMLFSRGLNLCALMHDKDMPKQEWQLEAAKCREFLLSLPDRLKNPNEFSCLRDELAALRSSCSVSAAECLEKEMQLVTHPPVDVVTETGITRQGQALHMLDDVLEELENALVQFDQTRNPPPHDRFHFAIRTWRDWRLAFENSLRASVSVFLAGVIWLTTGWPSGALFLMFVSIIASLFSTLETPVMASRAFMRGTIYVTAVAAFLAFLIVPSVSVYEMLAMCLIPPMMIGGLAFANPSIAFVAVSYNLFLTILISPMNDNRLDEITFFTTALPLFLSMAFCTWMYRVFLPLDPNAVRWDIRRQILRALRHLAQNPHPATSSDIVGAGTERMVRLMNTVGTRRGPIIEAYLQGILSGITVGLAILNLRGLLVRNNMPPEAGKNITAMLNRMAQFTGRYGGHYGRTERATLLAVSSLVKLEQHETNISQRVEMLRALAALRVIAAELSDNRLFFDASSPYLTSSSHDSVPSDDRDES